EEIKAATALYTQAADAYDAIAGKSQAQLAKDKAEADKALQAAMARAAKSRQTAQDAQAPVYFPNDWKNAEAKNQAGQSAKKTTPDEIKAATALYTQAADAYDDLAGKSRTQLAQDRENADKALEAAMARAEQSRKNAQEAQAPVYFPNDWKNAEAKNQAGQNAKKSTPEEIKAATALYTQAADAYDSMTAKTQSQLAKDKADADKALQAAMARAEQSRKNAQEAQAPVNYPADWKNAETTRQNGQNAKKDTTDEIKAATALYTQAADAYDSMTAKTQSQLAKEREEADKALQAAMARAEQSRKNAQEAQAPVYFPNDWKNAETKNQAGQSAKKTTPDEIKAAAALYTQAADAYDDMAGKSQSQLAKDREEAEKALQTAIARAEQSRNQAMGYQGPSYFPNDWKNAEAKNQAGQSAKKTTPDEIKAATALYTQAADTYDDIAGKSRPQYLESWEAQVAKERGAAIDAGITEAGADHLAAADRLAEETRRNLRSNTYIPNESETNLPIDMYRSLKPRAEGYKVRQEIVRQGLENTDRANLAAGDADTQVAIQEYESRRAQKSLEMANSALDKYNAVLKSGQLALAQTRMNEAGRERQIAIDAKAPVAVKDDFDIAETAYQQAVNDFNNGKYEAAAAGYSQSALQFLAAAEAAEKKRRLAEEAIAAAKRKTAESTAFATNTGLAMEENNE
ncbi:MAG: hypothetical protein LBG90_02855, partial [Spirochaetaceae bacterium]|nr:hypothetical protein [Spirochaetaceae bacterium]